MASAPPNTRTVAGVTYARGPDGRWYPQGAPAQPMVARPADPRLPIQTQRERVGLERDTNAAAASQYDAEIARANAARAQAEATTAQANASAGGLTAQQRNALTAQMVQLENASRQIDALENLYQQDFQGGRGSVFGLGGSRNPSGYLPNWLSERNQRFNNAANALMSPVAGAEGLTAQQQNTPAELQIRFGPNIPSSSDTDQTIEDKIGRLRSIIDTQRQSLTAQLGPSASAAVVQPREQMDRTNPLIMGDDPNAAPQLQLSNGREQMDPARLAILRQAQQRITGMLRSGASDREIADYARQQGLDATSALRFRQTPQFRQWNSDPRTRNQVYPLDLSASNVPMGGVAGAVASAAASPLGTGIIQGGNAIIPAALLARATGGDPEQARLGIEATQQANPTSALLGNLAGSALAYSAGGGLAGRAGTALETAAPRVANFLRAPGPVTALTPRAIAGDAAYGALQGYGENDDPLSGAGEAIAGGMFGRGAIRGLGRAVAPTGGRVASLYSMGVNPSPGQRFGGLLNGIEQRLQDIPGVGNVVRGWRQGARDQFQRGVVNDSLGQIGETLPRTTELGNPAMAYGQDAFDRAYDTARSGMAMRPDANFGTDLGQLQRTVGTLTEDGQRRFNRIWTDSVARRLRNAGGVLNGDDYKSAVSELGAHARRINDPELSGALRGAQDVLDAAARRQSAPEAAAALDAADRGYSRWVRIENAARRRGSPSGEFTPTQYDAAIQNADSSVRDRSYLSGRTVNSDIAREGMSLVDTIPDSGTPARWAQIAGMNALAGGSAYLEPNALLGMGGLAAAYSPPARAIVGTMLRPRSSRLGSILRGDEPILDRRIARYFTAPRIGGMFGAPLVQYDLTPRDQ